MSPSDWLSSYKDKPALELYCTRCGVVCQFRPLSLLNMTGDCQLKGLTGRLARGFGCGIVDRPSYGTWCKAVIQQPNEPIRREPSIKPLPDDMQETYRSVELRNIPEWLYIHIVCKCGHRSRVDHRTLIRRYGRHASLNDTVGGFICKKCGKRDAKIMVYKIPR